jgi:hypothetical protein
MEFLQNAGRDLLKRIWLAGYPKLARPCSEPQMRSRSEIVAE